MRSPFRLILSPLLLVLPLAASAAGGHNASDTRAIVGTVLSSGTFEVAHTTASGTATILNGDEVASAANSSKIMLKGGSEMELYPHSASLVYDNHATLQDGTMKTKLANNFFVTSRNLTVRATVPQTEAILQTSAKSLIVSVPAGGADVIAANGIKLVHMVTGSTFDFGGYDTTDTSVNVARILGVLDSENGHYLVRDRFTNTVSELAGPVDSKLLNHLVVIDGNVLTNDKPNVAQVDNLVQVSRVQRSDATTYIPCTPDGNSGIAKIVHLDGLVSKIREHFLVQDKKQNKTFEVVGDVEDKDVGTNLVARGFVLPKRQALLPAEEVVYTEHRNFVAAASPCVGAIVAGGLITSGTLLIPGAGAAAATALKQTPISY